MVMARKVEKISLNRKQREGMKAREIHARYPKSKAEKLISTLKSKGLWYYDPDFDKDEEESGNMVWRGAHRWLETCLVD